MGANDSADTRRLHPLGDVLRDACVLIVDDQLANVALLERIIRSAGIHHVHGVTDPRQAVPRCLGVGADLVLLDLRMPHMDGFAVLAALQAALPEDAFVPVVVLTADGSTAARDRALAAGAHDFLSKPFDLSEVTLRVRNLLHMRALYLNVQANNATLRADLAEREKHEKEIAAKQQERLRRVDQALRGDVLNMVFQPIVNIATGEVIGMEALARFDCVPRRPPNEWFDEAAMVGRGAELELAALTAAFDAVDLLPSTGFLSVNLSPATAMVPDLEPMLEKVPAHRLVVELTEHTLIDDYGALLPAIDSLRDKGVRIAVDDAGAGYSGLRHVLDLRPEILKLDTALTRGIDTDPARRALATALVSFAAEINAVIVAEGIETQVELETLRDLGITLGQGYHIARPAPAPLDVPTHKSIFTPS